MLDPGNPPHAETADWRPISSRRLQPELPGWPHDSGELLLGSQNAQRKVVTLSRFEDLNREDPESWNRLLEHP